MKTSITQYLQQNSIHSQIAQIKEAIIKDGIFIIRNESNSLNDFIQLSNSLISEPIIHHGIGTGQRESKTSDNLVASVDKGTCEIPLHREYSYAAGGPDIMMFFCNIPPLSEGETTLFDGEKFLNDIPTNLKSSLEKITLKWCWNVPHERWGPTLKTFDKLEAITKLKAIEKTCHEWESQNSYFDGDNLIGEFITPCCTYNRWSNRRAFCNYLMNYFYREFDQYYKKPPLELEFIDSDNFLPDNLDFLKSLADQYTIKHAWKYGDVVIIDNLRFMHGRQKVTDAKRDIFLKIGKINW